jgi:S-formylglutathione hydrolase FrmB
MAVLRLDHVPEAVGLTLPLYVILPDPAKMAGAPLAGRKVLYLLHGLSDDGSAWQRYTSIESVANAYGLVVVMPSAGRSFYTDQPNGARYFTYLTAELPRYLGEVFNLHPRREDTFIAGNSMGGYGAMKAALLHPEMYAAAGSFSGVLTLAVFQLLPDDTRQLEFAQLFGDLDSLAGGEHDPAAWLDSLVARGEPSLAPRLFLSVGRQEDIYPLTGMFHNLCQSKGVSSEYFEEDGRHDWFLWDRHIRRFLEFAIGPIPG